MNKRIWVLFAVLCMLLSLCACMPTGSPDSQSTGTTAGTEGTNLQFTLVIVHADGSEKKLTVDTNQTYLANALVDEKILAEYDSSGMYITVDGETADWNANQSYWSFYVGEDYATEGINTTKIENGATYKLVYTLG